MPRKGVMLWRASPKSVTLHVGQGGIGTEVFTGNAVRLASSASCTRRRNLGCQSSIRSSTRAFNFNAVDVSGDAEKPNRSRWAEKPHMTYSSASHEEVLAGRRLAEYCTALQNMKQPWGPRNSAGPLRMGSGGMARTPADRSSLPLTATLP